MAMANASNTTAPTQFIQTKLEKYAYRRIGKGPGLPLLCLRHFNGTLDNWDPAVTDALTLGREVILFESAGLGRSTGQVPENVTGMAAHALAFVDALGLKRLDILGYSLGGMVAQQMALERPSLVHKMLLVTTAPEGGEDIMHMNKPELRKITEDPNMAGLEKLVKLSFAPKQVESGGRRSLRTSASPKNAGWRASGRPRCRNRSDHGLSRLGKVQWRAFRQARRDTSALLGHKRGL